MASILPAADGSSWIMPAASPSVMAATGSGGVSVSARESEVSGAEAGGLMLTGSLLSFDQRRLNGFVMVIPGSDLGKRRVVAFRQQGAGLERAREAARQGPARIRALDRSRRDERDVDPVGPCLDGQRANPRSGRQSRG